MASSVIHMCIAKEINKKLDMPLNMLLLGSIAPDISKHVGETKTRSHFLKNGEVDISSFLEKYRSKLDDPFIMGYFIHLYTDYLWDKYFVSEIIENDSIRLIDGTKIKKDKALYKKLTYQDYTNLNVSLLDEYSLDLSLFYNEAKLPSVEMDEIPISKLQLIIDKTGIIIENTKVEKAYTFNMEHIKAFIETSRVLIEGEIEKLLNI